MTNRQTSAPSRTRSGDGDQSPRWGLGDAKQALGRQRRAMRRLAAAAERSGADPRFPLVKSRFDQHRRMMQRCIFELEARGGSPAPPQAIALQHYHEAMEESLAEAEDLL